MNKLIIVGLGATGHSGLALMLSRTLLLRLLLCSKQMLRQMLRGMPLVKFSIMSLFPARQDLTLARNL